MSCLSPGYIELGLQAHGWMFKPASKCCYQEHFEAEITCEKLINLSDGIGVFFLLHMCFTEMVYVLLSV